MKALILFLNRIYKTNIRQNLTGSLSYHPPFVVRPTVLIGSVPTYERTVLAILPYGAVRNGRKGRSSRRWGAYDKSKKMIRKCLR